MKTKEKLAIEWQDHQPELNGDDISAYTSDMHDLAYIAGFEVALKMAAKFYTENLAYTKEAYRSKDLAEYCLMIGNEDDDKS